MKRIITLFITALLLLSCFSFTAFAGEFPEGYPENEGATILSKKTEVTFSEDLKTLYFGKEEYVRCSAENVYNEILAELNNKINLSSKQEKEINEITLSASENGVLIDAYIEFTDGAYLSSCYIKAKYLPEYNKIIAGDFAFCEVDFFYPEYNKVKLSADVLSGEKVTIKNAYNKVDDWFSVLVSTEDENVVVEVGILIISGGEYYYASYDELGSDRYGYDIYNEESVTAHKITDKEAVALLNEAQENYYESDMGFFYDDDFTTGIADVFLVVVFGVLPFVILVIFTVFAIRSKQIYRKMCATVALLCAAEIIVFTIIAIIVT